MHGTASEWNALALRRLLLREWEEKLHTGRANMFADHASHRGSASRVLTPKAVKLNSKQTNKQKT